MIIDFFIIDGKMHFAIPENEQLEKAVRESIKSQTCKAGKAEYFFQRGVRDAAESIQSGRARSFGTPMLEVKGPFQAQPKIVSCQEAKELFQLGGTYEWRQISGSKLPEDYFSNIE